MRIHPILPASPLWQQACFYILLILYARVGEFASLSKQHDQHFGGDGSFPESLLPLLTPTALSWSTPSHGSPIFLCTSLAIKIHACTHTESSYNSSYNQHIIEQCVRKSQDTLSFQISLLLTKCVLFAVARGKRGEQTLNLKAT